MSSEPIDGRFPSERLFSYGTLQQDEVQLAAFGRNLAGEPDALTGYRVTMSSSSDQNFNASSGATRHRNLVFTGNTSDVVEGTVFRVTTAELEQADAYEPYDYKRVQVSLRSGIEAWVYLKRPDRANSHSQNRPTFS
jgi:Gamma-glutamyl cyclotransferase, AIG2-like